MDGLPIGGSSDVAPLRLTDFLRRVTPPLTLMAGGGHAVGVRRALEIGGLAFMSRWALGGAGYYVATAAIALWETTYLRARQEVVSFPRKAVASYTFFICGVGGVWNAIGHTILADQVARGIGWPTGSPFQLELGAAHLAWGLAGLLTARLRWQSIALIATTKVVFLFGAAAVHLRELAVSGNHAPLNAGVMTLWVGDLLVPAGVLALVVAGSRNADPPAPPTEA